MQLNSEILGVEAKGGIASQDKMMHGSSDLFDV
jgi:hypothetical protein